MPEADSCSLRLLLKPDLVGVGATDSCCGCMGPVGALSSVAAEALRGLTKADAGMAEGVWVAGSGSAAWGGKSWLTGGALRGRFALSSPPAIVTWQLSRLQRHEELPQQTGDRSNRSFRLDSHKTRAMHSKLNMSNLHWLIHQSEQSDGSRTACS